MSTEHMGINPHLQDERSEAVCGVECDGVVV